MQPESTVDELELSSEEHFELTPELLEKWMKLALQDDEFQKARPGIDDKLLIGELKKREEKIRTAAAQEMTELMQAEDVYLIAKRKFEEHDPSKTRSFRMLDVVRRIVIGTLLMAVVTGGVGIYLRVKQLFASLLTMPWILAWLMPLVVSMAGAVLIATLSRRFQADQEIKRKEERERLNIDRLWDTVKTLRLKVKEAVRHKGVGSELRAIVNSEKEPSYATNLSVTNAPGLAEVFDAAYEIPTHSRRKVIDLLENMPGGSIGIAGPRGAGKSTLLWSLCRGAVTSLKGRELFALMTSAPVKYDSRDFILHLCSSLCHRVLGIKPGDKILDQGTQQTLGAVTGQTWFARPLNAAIYLLPFGIALLLLGFFLAVQLMERPGNQSQSVHGTNLPLATRRGSTNTSARTDLVEKPIEQPPQPDNEYVRQWLKATEIKPGVFILLGLLCAVTGATALLYRNRHAENQREAMERERERDNHVEGIRKRLGPAITDAAFRMLREIRFQRSYSSGWSGSLSLPVGVEGSLEGAMSLAEQQRSVPEIVDAYRSFVSLLTEKNVLLIGIDELDKLESDEAAQQFLNGIKSIFGLDHCYYLVSVSENAISSFERRGLPIRDAFDSAFDTIVYVDYLNLEKAKRLLNRRVIGMEVPFVCLCHALSGGLARDLVRACRELLEFAREENAKSNLGSLCGKLIMTDVKAKLRALTVSAMRASVEPDTSKFLECIQSVENATDSVERFLSCVKQLQVPTFLPVPEALPDAVARRQQTHSLRLEMHTYLYFAATLLGFFSTNLTAAKLKTAEAEGAIDKLARARQSFAVNPYLARTLLDDFHGTTSSRFDIGGAQPY
jgi:hypothetical protein